MYILEKFQKLLTNELCQKALLESKQRFLKRLIFQILLTKNDRVQYRKPFQTKQYFGLFFLCHSSEKEVRIIRTKKKNQIILFILDIYHVSQFLQNISKFL